MALFPVLLPECYDSFLYGLSGRGGVAPVPSHTTGHAGPHPAVRQAVGLRLAPDLWPQHNALGLLSDNLSGDTLQIRLVRNGAMGRELVDKGRELLSAAPTGIDLQVPGTVGAPIVPFPRADTRSELLACVTSAHPACHHCRWEYCPPGDDGVPRVGPADGQLTASG